MAQLFGRFDIVVVFPGLAGIVEQDHAAEAITGRKLRQPCRDGLAEETEDEEFADLHCALPSSPSPTRADVPARILVC